MQRDRWDFMSETFITPSSELKRFQTVRVLRHKSASFNFRHAGSGCCYKKKTQSARRRRDCKLVNNRCCYEGLARTLQLQHVFLELVDIRTAFLFTRFGSGLRCASARRRHRLTPIGSLPLSPSGSDDRKAPDLVNETDRRFVQAPTSSGRSCGDDGPATNYTVHPHLHRSINQYALLFYRCTPTWERGQRAGTFVSFRFFYQMKK